MPGRTPGRPTRDSTGATAAAGDQPDGTRIRRRSPNEHHPAGHHRPRPDRGDRARAFYHDQLGWRLDIDFEPGPGLRGVQITPPGSAASIQFGSGGPMMAGPLLNLYLVVDDIAAFRDDLISRGVEVSELFHIEIGKGVLPGPDPQGQSYATRATFPDPDGNVWMLQEVTDRIPGRV
jgi:predicted enzyme related to lactoylglutathione lyase